MRSYGRSGLGEGASQDAIEIAWEGFQESAENRLRVIVDISSVGPKARMREDPSHAVAVRGAESESLVENSNEVCLRLRRFRIVTERLCYRRICCKRACEPGELCSGEVVGFNG